MSWKLNILITNNIESHNISKKYFGKKYCSSGSPAVVVAKVPSAKQKHSTENFTFSRGSSIRNI
jgi:hypothetical protein